MTDKIIIKEIQTDNGKRIGLVTLNDPKTINALSLEMIRALYPKLLSWQNDDELVAVFLHSSSERGLCSGGNIRHIYDSMVDDRVVDNPEVENDAVSPNPLALEFFSEEYQLNQLIHAYEKPIVVWGHGIVMGGGVGLMVGASHRVVTAESTLAMPEIGIGLFPDVGGSWFLNRMPDGCGLFVGLTGARLQCSDALFTGLADFILANDDKQQILNKLKSCVWQLSPSANRSIVSELLESADICDSFAAGELEVNLEKIQRLTDGNDLVTITDNLLGSVQKTEANDENTWWNSSVTALKNGCPTTAHLVYQQILRAKDKSLSDIFTMELNMAMQCVAAPDFREGVRALLVDKDRNPAWRHKSVSEVPTDWIEQHFQPFDLQPN